MNQAELTIEKLRYDEKIAFQAKKSAEEELKKKNLEHERARFLLEVSEHSYKAKMEAGQTKATPAT